MINKTRQSSEWKSSPPPPPCNKKFRVYRAKGKAMRLIFFLYCQGMVHYEFIPEGKTVSGEMFIDIHHCLRDMVRRKHLEN